VTTTFGRRAFVATLGGAAAALLRPRAARAQQPALPVVGFLSPGSADSNGYTVDWTRRGLAEVGYVEGRNVTIEYRWAEGHYDRLPELAAELAHRRVDVIVAAGSDAPALAAKAVTSTIPIVFQTGADPIADGLVASMNRPGGNVTGVSRMTILLDPKRLEVLHQAVPSATSVGVLVNRNSPRAELVIDQIQKAARSLGLGIAIMKIGAENELEGAFATIAQEGAGALMIANDPAMGPWADKIVALAIQHGLPAMANARSYVVAGALMSYDSSLTDSYRQVGVYVGRILKGAKPPDLPILEPTKFELVLNLKTAKALGLMFPQSMVVAADEVIE
jgi:putative tryptophan/tyrosine transport system substrate-binding protein